MNKEDLEHFEGLIVKAIQATKGENSGLIGQIQKDISDLKGNYSKRELDHFITEIKENVEKILIQTTKTNGRVNSLENHRSYLWGAYTLLFLLGSVIIGLSIDAIDSKIKEENRATISSPEFKQLINQSIEQALIDNVSTIEYEK